MERKTRILLKFLWAFGMIALGLLLNHFNLGVGSFVCYGSVGSYLIYAGFLSLIVISLAEVFRKKQVKDERMEFVAAKAMRATFSVFVVVAFVLMIVDGIQPISMPYHLFLSYLVAGMLAVLVISYKILLRLY